MPFLIHADPGARSGFISAWLQHNLEQYGFDVGKTSGTKFFKIHRLVDNTQLTTFSGIRIRVKPTFNQMALWLLLFLKKNVYTQIPNFTKDEFSLETFSKVYIFAKECFEHDANLDYSLYDHTITFADTFDMNKMAELYYKCLGQKPTQDHVEHAMHHNKLNQFYIDPNHACNIASIVLELESTLNLKEKDRRWSLPEIYKTTDISDLYNTIKLKISTPYYFS
jgi:hypothetical protein